MKRKNWLSYLFAALIALQSFAGIADVHQLHQSGAEHLNFEENHEHAHVDQQTKDVHATPIDASEELDCHHCCHCHGHFTPALLDKVFNVYYKKSSNGVPAYVKSVTPEIINPLLRPPIA